jgi:hypothetical protein
MKLSRLLGYLKGKLTEVMMTTREKKIKAALESAKVNAEEEKINAELKLEELSQQLATTDNVTNIIEQMSNAFDDKKDAELKLERIKQIKNYLEEEVEIEEETKAAA